MNEFTDKITPDFFVQGFTAFFGAFFAYFFLRVGEFFRSLYARQVKHYNSLVTFETQLNEIDTIVQDNLYILPDFISTLEAQRIYFNTLYSLPIDLSRYANLYDLDLLNLLFVYYDKIRRLNNDIRTVNTGYAELKAALIQKNIDQQTYRLNCNNIANNLKHLRAFLGDFQQKTNWLQARIRIQIKKDKPLGIRFQQLLVWSAGPKIDEEQIEEELKTLLQEKEQTRTESKREIEQIKNN